MISDYILVCAAGLCILCGAVTEALSVFGVFKYRFALNRMHVSALGDTLGLFLITLGLVLLNGFQPSSLKFCAVVVMMWVTSPISTHLLAKLEYLTDPSIGEHCNLPEDKQN